MGKAKAPKSGSSWQDVEIQRMKLEDEQRNREHEEAKARDAENVRGAAFADSLRQGVEGLQSRGRTMVRNRGLDENEFASTIDEAVHSTRRRIDPKDANPGAYFTDSVIDEALGRVRDERRAAYGANANANFAQGYEDQYFGSGSDDAIIDDILGRQRADAVAFAERARNRGQLDPTGYGAAMARIGEMQSAGRAQANKLGEAVLQGNRTRLADIGNEARTAAGSYELGQNFDLNTFGRRREEALANMQGSFEGDIRGALEGQKFFDVGDLISRAGTAQGATNPASESMDALAAREKQRTYQRGVGSRGGF